MIVTAKARNLMIDPTMVAISAPRESLDWLCSIVATWLVVPLPYIEVGVVVMSYVGLARSLLVIA